MLMFDRITHISDEGGAHGKGQIIAELDVKPDLWFFKCHFEGDPVMPGCLGLDALWQMVGFFLGWLGAPGKGRALGLGEVKFSGQVLPNVKKVIYGIDLKRVMRSKLVLGIADGFLSADGNVIPPRAAAVKTHGPPIDDFGCIEIGRAMHLAAEPKLGVFVGAHDAGLGLAQTRQDFLRVIADG